jgi:hypothetical protein
MPEMHHVRAMKSSIRRTIIIPLRGDEAGFLLLIGHWTIAALSLIWP